ncbi:MAG: hypothetical protein KBT47_01780 [Armatimonadetes bacterium]|nr:hypothetical protein [Candidatus Hippobium faecium]
MKKLFFVSVLLILGIYAFGADLHIAPYSDYALTYAQNKGYNTIIWFEDQSNNSAKLKNEILGCGQLIAATEDVIWLGADVTDRNIRLLAEKLNIREFPTLICLDTEGRELYGSRFSYGLMDRNIPLPQTFLMSLAANNVIDWEVGDSWFDDRYIYNNIRYVDCSYWNYSPSYDYGSVYYTEPGRMSDRNRADIFMAVLTFLYRLYPNLSPLQSNSYTNINITYNTYYSYDRRPRVVIYRDRRPPRPPKRIVFAGAPHRGGSIIRTIDEYEREHHRREVRKVYTWEDRERITPQDRIRRDINSRWNNSSYNKRENRNSHREDIKNRRENRERRADRNTPPPPPDQREIKDRDNREQKREIEERNNNREREKRDQEEKRKIEEKKNNRDREKRNEEQKREIKERKDNRENKGQNSERRNRERRNK